MTSHASPVKMSNFSGLCLLQSEKERWSQAVVQYEKQKNTLCGDVLITSAFVSYMGYFTRQYRAELLHKAWIPFLQSQKVRPGLHHTFCCLDSEYKIVLSTNRQQRPQAKAHCSPSLVTSFWFSVPGLCTPDRRPGSSPHAYRWCHCGCLA